MASSPATWAAAPSASEATVAPAAPPTVAILLVVDRSGSMSYDPLGRTSKIEMTQEALRLAAGALGEGDQFGILAFNDQQLWLVEMTTIADAQTREAIGAAIDRLTAEGGTEILPALALGLDAIRAVDADARHLLLLSDGKSRTGTREEYQQIVDAATAGGVTLSTVAIGDDADTALLQFLAREGGGRYQDATTIDGLPGFVLDEARVAMGGTAGVPDPAECRVAPRPTSGIPAANGSPVAARPALLRPTDAAATPDTVVAISVTWREVWACIGAGAPDHAAALFTDDGLRRTVVTHPDWAAFLGSVSDADLFRYQVRPFPYNLVEAWTLPDGRVGTIFSPDPLLDASEIGSPGIRYTVAFAPATNRWLVDEFQMSVG